MQIELTDQPIDPAVVLQTVHSVDAGATVLFVGTTRRMTGDRQTESLDYECYREMAEEQLRRLAGEAQQQWALLGIGIVHRLGRVPVGEPSVAIAVSSAHRAPAFEAGRWLMDRIKEVVPIWKRERFADGTTQWVHPASGESGSDTPVDAD